MIAVTHSSAKLCLAAVSLMLLGSTAGCANARSFFQMSSDSPVPFFGFDLKLPNKLSQQSSPAADQPVAVVEEHVEGGHQGRRVTDADTSGDQAAFADSEPFGAEYVIASTSSGGPEAF